MALWTNREVDLVLSADGQQALKGIFDERVITVLVEWADELGLWALQQAFEDGSKTVILIKWSFFDSAVMRVLLEAPVRNNVLGFRGPRS